MERSPPPKFAPPHLLKVVKRPRLIRRLENNRDKRLWIVLGQAGQGKSTLGALYVHRCSVPWLWVNLDPEDSDPIHLLHSLSRALQWHNPTLNFAPLLEHPASTPDPPGEPILFRRWCTALTESVSSSPLLIVLDGLDRLDEESPSFRLIQTLWERLPDSVHLLLLSQREPPWNLHTLKLHRTALILENEDLAFTSREIAAFFRILRNISLSEMEAERIRRFTEGWAGGLILLCEALDRLTEEERRSYLERGLPERFRGELFGYIGERIFAALSRREQEFLIKSSLFDVVEPGLAAQLVPGAPALGILEELSRRNMFVARWYGEQGEVLFRYHRILKDFLQAKFRTEIRRNQQRILLTQAGHLLESSGDLEQACRFYLEAAEYSRAVRLIHRLSSELIRQGRTGDLSRWIQALPERLVQQDPWLLFYSALAQRRTMGGDNLSLLNRALEQFEQQEDLRGLLLCHTFRIEAAILAGVIWNASMDYLEAADTLVERTNPAMYPMDQAMLLYTIGFGYSIQGNAKKGLLVCRRAYSLSSSIKNSFLESRSLCNYVISLGFAGNIPKAYDLLEKLSDNISVQDDPFLLTDYLLASSFINTLYGDIHSTKTFFENADRLIEEHGLTFYYPLALIYKLLASMVEENFDQIQALAQRLIELGSATRNLYLEGIARGVLSAGYYRNGEWDAGRTHAEQALRLLSPDRIRATWQLHCVKAFAALMAYHQGDLSFCDKMIGEALEYFSGISNSMLTGELLLAGGLLAWKRGDPQGAAARLREGFLPALWEENPQRSFFLLSRTDAARACALALELGAGEAERRILFFMRHTLPDLSKREMDRLIHAAERSTAVKAKRIKRALHRGTLEKLSIQTLGRFLVRRGDREIQEEEWKGVQARTLLKAILATGGREISQDMLAEILWPESNPQKAIQNMKVALHRLRRILEPNLDPQLGSSYLHVRENRVFLDAELCRLDLEDFRAGIASGTEKQRRGDTRGALLEFERAAERYAGDFLSEDPYADWARPLRERLRQECIQLWMTMAGLHESRGSFRKTVACYRRALHMDPCLEEAYQRLMINYLNTGNKSEAAKVFQECKKALQTHLDVKPGEVTVAIYRKLL